jgi:hypothetical protein
MHIGALGADAVRSLGSGSLARRTPEIDEAERLPQSGADSCSFDAPALLRIRFIHFATTFM